MDHGAACAVSDIHCSMAGPMDGWIHTLLTQTCGFTATGTF